MKSGIKKFGLLGAGGYIAPRHMAAIRDTGNILVAALDPNDSVGVMDSYFPKADFFTEFERFDRHIHKLQRQNKGLDFISICTPNHLHESQARFALRSGADVICEKPLVLNSWNVDGLLEVEKETGFRVSTILQLRVHPAIVKLRNNIQKKLKDKKYEVDLTYITSRGHWYLQSWKGDKEKSGGIATNIGIHFFDMLHFIFGKLQDNKVHFHSKTKASGYLEYEQARVRWFLSIDINDVPKNFRDKGYKTYRSITVDGEEIEFSVGFSDLHIRSYEEIMAGRGFSLEDNRVAIETVSYIRTAPIYNFGERHPFIQGMNR